MPSDQTGWETRAIDDLQSEDAETRAAAEKFVASCRVHADTFFDLLVDKTIEFMREDFEDEMLYLSLTRQLNDKIEEDEGMVASILANRVIWEARKKL